MAKAKNSVVFQCFKTAAPFIKRAENSAQNQGLRRFLILSINVIVIQRLLSVDGMQIIIVQKEQSFCH